MSLTVDFIIVITKSLIEKYKNNSFGFETQKSKALGFMNPLSLLIWFNLAIFEFANSCIELKIDDPITIKSLSQ